MTPKKMRNDQLRLKYSHGVRIRSVTFTMILVAASAASLSACSGTDPSAPLVQIASDNTPAPSPAPSPSPGGDSTKPTVSITSPAAGAVVSGTRSLTASAADNVGVAGVQFRVNGVNAGAEDTSSPYSISYDTTQVANGAYTLTAVARDAAGNTTTSAAIAVTVSNAAPAPTDTSAPSVPSGLTASAASSFQINLAWKAATDNVGVIGYKVYRNGSEIGATTQLSFAATGLAAQTDYTFQVAAYDAGGNVSGKSAAASAKTLAATVGTSLSDLAARLKVGEWAKLETVGYNGGDVLKTPEGGYITEFSNEMLWDPTQRRLFVAGTARGAGGYGIGNQGWAVYRDADNQWERLPNMPFYLGFHSYDHGALDTSNGDYYMRVVGTTDVWRYDGQTNAWSQIAPIDIDSTNCCEALEYFPELGGVVFVQGSPSSSMLRLYKRSTNQWTTLVTSSVAMGEYHIISEYDPVHKVLYMGGGVVWENNGETNRYEIYKLDSAGKTARIADSPVPLGPSAAVTVVDPVSGAFLLFPKGTPGNFYEYDFSANVWRLRSIQSSFRVTDNGGNFNAFGTSIPEHGVLIFGHTTDGIWLYKHAAP